MKGPCQCKTPSGFNCGSYAYNLHRYGIDQVHCDVHHYQQECERLQTLLSEEHRSAQAMLDSYAAENQQLSDREVAALAECERLRKVCSEINDSVSQTLGRALQYPKFADDQKNFPGATDADGVCVGDHIAGSLAEEAAKEIVRLRNALRNMTDDRDSWSDQASNRLDDAVRFLEERDKLKADMKYLQKNVADLTDDRQRLQEENARLQRDLNLLRYPPQGVF